MKVKIILGIIAIAALVSIDGIVYHMQTVNADSSNRTVEQIPSLVLDEAGIRAGKEEWRAFVKSANSQKPAQIRIEKRNFAKEILLQYDGKYHLASEKDYRLASGKEYRLPSDKEYRYLLELTGHLPNAANDSTYVILSDEQYSFDEVAKSIYSSNSGDWLTYELLFCL